MEEKKTSKNLYGIISLCLMVLTAILEFIGLMNANFIFVVLSIITGISGIVLAIIGIVKATKLKKQIGKLKGIVLSIISIVFSLGILVVSIMEFGVLIYEQESGDTKFSIFAKSANLTEDEQIIGQGIKAMQNKCGIGEFKVNDITVYKRDGGFDAFIDYTFTSVTLGKKTERQKVLLHHIYSETNTQKPSSSIYEYGGNVYELISKSAYMMEEVKVNQTKIIEYSKDKNTKMLDIN